MAKKKPDDAEAGNGSMTKADAVRAAIQEGVDKPQDACEWIKTKFNIDITPAHFSSYKSGFKKKDGKYAGRPGRNPREAATPHPRAGALLGPDFL